MDMAKGKQQRRPTPNTQKRYSKCANISLSGYKHEYIYRKNERRYGVEKTLANTTEIIVLSTGKCDKHVRTNVNIWR